MLVNKRLEIGLRLLLDLAKNPDQLHRARDLAQKEGFPETSARQILLALSRAGILSSEIGRQGGYKLAKPPEKIRLAEVLRVLGGDGLELALFGRGRQKPIPLERSSPTFPFFSSLERKFWEELKDRSLADLL
jgi:Rrf2 family protein